MKIFISWSGEVSRKTADILKKWIPCFFESVEVFFSPDDIEKGRNWNRRITEELANCNYGVVCLTSENKNAPWINFEAGAIAKAFDSSVTALLVDVNPSDIQGPLSMFQATMLREDDIHKLIIDINGNLEKPRSEETLNNLFNALWNQIEEDFKDILANISSKPKVIEKKGQDEILESILQAVREQSRILSDPENFLPKEYSLAMLQNKIKNEADKQDLIDYTKLLLMITEKVLEEGRPLSSAVLDYIDAIVKATKEMMENQRINIQGIWHIFEILVIDIELARREIKRSDEEKDIR